MRLSIPDPALVLLIGPSGAGKSTFAAKHFKPTEIVSSDDIRAMLTDDAGDQDSSSEAFHVLTLLVNGRLKRRLTTVIDATNLGAANRKSSRAVAVRFGVPTVAICFDLDWETYQARNSARAERYVDADVIDRQVSRMAGTLAELRTEQYSALHVIQEQDLDDGITLDRFLT